MVADALEPGELLGGERRGRRSPAGASQASKRSRDLLGERDELVVLLEREADERDEVGEHALPAEPRTFERSSVS